MSIASEMSAVARLPAPIRVSARLSGPEKRLIQLQWLGFRVCCESEITCIICWHCPQIVVKLSPPLVGGFKPVRLEQVIKKGEEHWVVVGQHKQVDSQQVGASLQM